MTTHTSMRVIVGAHTFTDDGTPRPYVNAIGTDAVEKTTLLPGTITVLSPPMRDDFYCNDVDDAAGIADQVGRIAFARATGRTEEQVDVTSPAGQVISSAVDDVDYARDSRAPLRAAVLSLTRAGFNVEWNDMPSPPRKAGRGERTCAICGGVISAATGYQCACSMSEPDDGAGPQGEDWLEYCAARRDCLE